MANSNNFLKLPSKKLINFRKGNPKNNPQNKLKSLFKGIAVYILIGLAILVFFAGVMGEAPGTKTIPLSEALNNIKDGKVEKLSVEGDKVTITFKDKQVGLTRKESGESIYQVLKNSEVDPKSVVIDVKDISWQSAWLGVLGSILPVVLFIGVMLYLVNKQSGSSGIFSFSQSRARMFTKDEPQVKFSDVAGYEESKKELEEVVDFLKNPAKYKELGARTPKGVLLVGPPGTGKTLLSRAVAGEAGVPFFSIAGSEFMEMLVGVGAARVRDMFATAKKAAPAIIFIDEIESIGRARGFGISGGHDEREQTLNQILVEMDGFAPNESVIILGATNRPDLLDPALVRPGRFDRRVVVGLPDLAERRAIISLHMKGKPFLPEVSEERIARRTVGFSGADLANMINEAAILAAREDKKEIDAKMVEEAATKVKLGPQRKRMQSEKERRMTAYHEAGHALVGHMLPNVDPVHRITIVSRGMTGGHTLFPPTEDRSNETKSRLLEQIATALGGRAAEEIVFKDISTGASNDIDVASGIAREMVTQYGMSGLGHINIKRSSGGMYGREDGVEISESLQSKIDVEVKKIMDDGYKKAIEILKKNRAKLDKVSVALLETETLDTDEFEKIVGKKKVS